MQITVLTTDTCAGYLLRSATHPETIPPRLAIVKAIHMLNIKYLCWRWVVKDPPVT